MVVEKSCVESSCVLYSVEETCRAYTQQKNLSKKACQTGGFYAYCKQHSSVA